MDEQLSRKSPCPTCGRLERIKRGVCDHCFFSLPVDLRRKLYAPYVEPDIIAKAIGVLREQANVLTAKRAQRDAVRASYVACPACGAPHPVPGKHIFCKRCAGVLPETFHCRWMTSVEQVDLAVVAIKEKLGKLPLYPACRACKRVYENLTDRALCTRCFFSLPTAMQILLRRFLSPDYPALAEKAAAFLAQNRKVKRCVGCHRKKRITLPPFCGWCAEQLNRTGPAIVQSLQWDVGSGQHDQAVAEAVALIEPLTASLALGN